jgi:hypothetical protein
VRVIVTGSRDYGEPETVWSALDEIRALGEPIVVVHGHCLTGADAFADVWARGRFRDGEDVRPERWEAKWRLYGNAAGPRRNREMVAAGADRCLAFFAPPPALNEGTAGCVKLARAAGIPVVEYGRKTVENEQETLPI